MDLPSHESRRNFGFVQASPKTPLPSLPGGTLAALVGWLRESADVREQQGRELDLPLSQLPFPPSFVREVADYLEHIYEDGPWPDSDGR